MFYFSKILNKIRWIFIDAGWKIPVKAEPSPAKEVAVNLPVEGTKDSFVELVVAALLPLEFSDKTG